MIQMMCGRRPATGWADFSSGARPAPRPAATPPAMTCRRDQPPGCALLAMARRIYCAPRFPREFAMRSHYAGQVSEQLGGQEVTVAGWVHRRRDHGGVIFVDLRDREGLLQVVFDPDDPQLFA